MTNINNPHLNEGKDATSVASKTGEIVSSSSNNVVHAINCQYPNHKGYAALRARYGNNESYKGFFSKLKIEGNEIIIDNKKFSLLSAEHNGKDIFSGDFEKDGQKGIGGLTYMSGEAAMREMKNQNKKLFKTEEEVNSFINTLPGKNTNEKESSLVTLFDLKKSGFWVAGGKSWSGVGNVGNIGLSEVNNGRVIHLTWLGDEEDSAYFLESGLQASGQPFIAFEDI